MEKVIMDLLNAGIGLFKSGKDGLNNAKTELEKVYGDIKAKGEQNNSEPAIKLKEGLDKIIVEIKEFSSVAGKNYDETRAKIVENFNKITQEIKEKMPEGKIEAIKEKINQVAESIQNFQKGSDNKTV